jgi:hypothetical protein
MVTDPLDLYGVNHEGINFELCMSIIVPLS